MAAPSFKLPSNGSQAKPTARHRAMSVYELCEAVRALAAAQLPHHLTACLASHMERSELHAWAEDTADELSIEVDRCLVELESRNLSGQDAEHRDMAWRYGWWISSVNGRLGVSVEVVRSERTNPTSSTVEQFASMIGGLENAIHEVTNISRLVSDKLEIVAVNEKGNHGEDIISFVDGEYEAFVFGVYEVDRRLRQLREDYLACLAAKGQLGGAS